MWLNVSLTSSSPFRVIEWFWTTRTVGTQLKLQFCFCILTICMLYLCTQLHSQNANGESLLLAKFGLDYVQLFRVLYPALRSTLSKRFKRSRLQLFDALNSSNVKSAQITEFVQCWTSGIGRGSTANDPFSIKKGHPVVSTCAHLKSWKYTRTVLCLD